MAAVTKNKTGVKIQVFSSNNSETIEFNKILMKDIIVHHYETVQNSARRDKRGFISKMTSKADEAARQCNAKALFDNIRLLTNKFKKSRRPMKGKDGNPLKTKEEQMERWVSEHFKEALNQQPSTTNT